MTDTRQAQARTSDRVRQIVILVGAVLAIVGAAWGSGAFGGTPIDEAAGGALAADATLLAPASPAFAIWSVIYTGLAVFAVVQALPSRSADTRMRSIGWLVLASLVLNAVWIGVIQAGMLALSIVVIAVLVLTLSVIAVRLVAMRSRSWLDLWSTDVPLGLYLGWVSVATAANVTAWGVDALGADAGAGTGWAVAVLVVVAAIAVALARYSRSNLALSIATGIALAWGLAWIAFGRAEGQPHDLVVMWAAGLAASVAFSAPFAVRDFTRASAAR